VLIFCKNVYGIVLTEVMKRVWQRQCSSGCDGTLNRRRR
jgi:hypothetical protein